VTFLAAKFLVALAVVLALLVAIALVWLPVLEVAGGVAGQPRGVGGVAVEQGLVSLVAAMIVSPALLAVALLLAVVVRRQGTIVGAFSGILCSVLTASIDAGSPTPLLFLMPAQRLAAGLLGSEAHPDLLQLDPLRSAVVLAVWVVGPLAIAGLVFSRRDIESGAA
jgi:ABC-type transport system involved in multi-copper enzyme maturation permease subunit